MLAQMEVLVRHRLEYGALVATAWLCRRLPHEAAIVLGWCNARIAFHIFRSRRRETLRRIESVFGSDCAPRCRRRIAWLSLRNIFFNAVEMMRADAYTERWMRRHVESYGEVMGRVRDLAAQHGGLVLALPHFGNWDLAGIAARMAGIPIFSVAGVQKNPLTNDWMNRQRGVGIDIIPRGSSALRQVVRRLRRGEVLAILPDVRTRKPDLSIPFLGGSANLGRGMAQFARVAGVPVLPVIARRVGWFRHRFDLLEPVFHDRDAAADDDLRRVTAVVMGQIEAIIRADPGQWFWYNKRWVLDPLEQTVPEEGATSPIDTQPIMEQA